ncbi:MAG: hypothetical protein R2856_28855 [Caldilineaceae bacterium]
MRSRSWCEEGLIPVNDVQIAARIDEDVGGVDVGGRGCGQVARGGEASERMRGRRCAGSLPGGRVSIGYEIRGDGIVEVFGGSRGVDALVEACTVSNHIGRKDSLRTSSHRRLRPVPVY